MDLYGSVLTTIKWMKCHSLSNCWVNKLLDRLGTICFFYVSGFNKNVCFVNNCTVILGDLGWRKLLRVIMLAVVRLYCPPLGLIGLIPDKARTQSIFSIFPTFWVLPTQKYQETHTAPDDQEYTSISFSSWSLLLILLMLQRSHVGYIEFVFFFLSSLPHVEVRDKGMGGLKPISTQWEKAIWANEIHVHEALIWGCPEWPRMDTAHIS